MDASSFEAGGVVQSSTAAWIVSFMDGLECPSCKATCTNLQRLSASLRGLPVEVGIVDCSMVDNKNFCYRDNELPPPPHRPLTKMYRSGPKNLTDEVELGELLYPPADIEPH